MQLAAFTRSTFLAVVLAAAGCARNNSSDTEVGAARDTSHVNGVQRLIALLHTCRARLGRVAVVGRSAPMFGISRQIAQMLDSDETPVQAFFDSAEASTWVRRPEAGVHSPA